jgi:hypothetical protein
MEFRSQEARNSVFPPGSVRWTIFRMTLQEIEQFGAMVTNLTGRRRSTGPRTEEGKLRSAVNAVKHGLSGRNLLLPGEDEAEYASKLDGIFVALAPRNDAEAEIVALVGDDIWKLGRLARVEKAITLGRIEELLNVTSSAHSCRLLTDGISQMARAITAWEMEPVPLQRDDEFTRRVRMLSEAITYVEDRLPEISRDLVETCSQHLNGVRGRKEDPAVYRQAYVEVAHAARVLMATLLTQGDQLEATQQGLRTAIATIALPDENELKKLTRYRRLLEDGLQRRLATLEQLRKLGGAIVRSEEEKATARDYRVRLRVVSV